MRGGCSCKHSTATLCSQLLGRSLPLPLLFPLPLPFPSPPLFFFPPKVTFSMSVSSAMYSVGRVLCNTHCCQWVFIISIAIYHEIVLPLIYQQIDHKTVNGKIIAKISSFHEFMLRSILQSLRFFRKNKTKNKKEDNKLNFLL